tara:strand:+ start:2869 stop:3045 length:177 start_codon:yes stop_codon:yes gene_type:complete
MRRLTKLPMKNLAPSQGREDKKIRREGELLRENLKRRKLQARTKAQVEETDLKCLGDK